MKTGSVKVVSLREIIAPGGRFGKGVDVFHRYADQTPLRCVASSISALCRQQEVQQAVLALCLLPQADAILLTVPPLPLIPAEDISKLFNHPSMPEQNVRFHANTFPREHREAFIERLGIAGLLAQQLTTTTYDYDSIALQLLGQKVPSDSPKTFFAQKASELALPNADWTLFFRAVDTLYGKIVQAKLAAQMDHVSVLSWLPDLDESNSGSPNTISFLARVIE